MKDQILEYNGTNKYWSVLFQDKDNGLYAIFAQLEEEPYINLNAEDNHRFLCIPLIYKANQIKLSCKEEYEIVRRLLALVWGE